ncbi:ABC transporter ATP-binding protein [Actinotalea ferrariae]|nr:ABC transporter ATP-binding protein [Actinotalea ferrariae]
MIRVESLAREFSGKGAPEPVHALRGVSFEVAPGELFGVLGPNGAGKTTLVRILSTLLTPTSGTAQIGGLDVVTDAMRLRRRLGVVFGGERGLYDRLTAVDNLQFAAELYGVHRREQKRRIGDVLELVGLRSKDRARVETFSRGMRQRLHIARALLHEPDVLFLDEPSNGLDPVAARELRDLVRSLRDAGTTILLTTHHMFEADQLCSRLAVVVDGGIVEMGTPAAIKGRADVGRTFTFADYHGVVRDRAVLDALPGAIDVSDEALDGYVRWSVRTAAGSAVDAAMIARTLDVPPDHVVGEPATLEDAYVAIVSGAP